MKVKITKTIGNPYYRMYRSSWFVWFDTGINSSDLDFITKIAMDYKPKQLIVVVSMS